MGAAIVKNTNTGALLAVGGLGLLAGRALRERMKAADLTGQVALVTGGSRGLGLLLAREFARAGCKIAICARDTEELTRAADALREGGATVFPVTCDVSDEAQVAAMIAQVTNHYGQVDILVNNAGQIAVGPVQEMTARDFGEMMNVIFWGTLHPTLAVLPQMRARRSGRIVNITSVGGKVSVPHLLPYSAAKFATVGFSEGLRSELARDGITATTIAPGEMRTGSYINATFKGNQEREFAWFALGDNLPFSSIDAERAAQLIVAATRRGEAERILTAPAAIASVLHGIAPGFTADVLSLVNRAILPAPPDKEGSDTKADAGSVAVRGAEIEPRERAMFQRLLGFGKSASRRFNERGMVDLKAHG